MKPASYGYFDFPTCVRYALVHSQAFLKSRLEIQIKSLDLKDSHSELMPTMKMETAVYISRAGGSTGNPVTVRYVVEHYNPLEALLSIKSRGIVVDIAKTTHQQKVAQGIAEIAKTFLEIEARTKLIRSQRAIGSKWDEKLAYLKFLEQKGKVEELWLARWELSKKQVGLEIERLKAERDELIDRLKTLIGYHPPTFIFHWTRGTLRIRFSAASTEEVSPTDSFREAIWG